MKSFRGILDKNRDSILAASNVRYNEDGFATISPDAPWFHEDIWDSHYKELNKDEYGYRIAAP